MFSRYQNRVRTTSSLHKLREFSLKSHVRIPFLRDSQCVLPASRRVLLIPSPSASQLSIILFGHADAFNGSCKVSFLGELKYIELLFPLELSTNNFNVQKDTHAEHVLCHSGIMSLYLLPFAILN